MVPASEEAGKVSVLSVSQMGRPARESMMWEKGKPRPPEVCAKISASRIANEKSRSRQRNEEKRDASAMHESYGAPGLVEWVRYQFRERIWVL